MVNMHNVVRPTNLLFVTLATARRCRAADLTPQRARETPGTFTLPAHLAFFHGFLPTPRDDPRQPRLLALEFDDSVTTAATTYAFSGVDNIVARFCALGYRTLCVGGVGFFNKMNPLGRLLPGLFEQSVWSPALGVTVPVAEFFLRGGGRKGTWPAPYNDP